MQEIDYWLWFALKNGINHRRRIALLERYGSPDVLFRMDKNKMKKEKLTLRERRLFSDKDMDYAKAVKERCKEVGIHILTYHNPSYPEKLKQIPDPPCLLYVRCKKRFNLNDKICISMVGNRNMTTYGELAAKDIASGLARAGVVVVSGMAAGVDSASHIGALNGDGLTVAVLGCGADVVYPRFNDRLMLSIIEQGMVITEYPPGTPPLGKHFPARNRIISGLSEGVVVVEAPVRSGSLITADLALKQNRDVFAVPGDINRYHSRGCNKLIYKGAILVNSSDDILREYEFVFRNILKRYHETANEEPKEEYPKNKTIKKEVVDSLHKSERFASLTENQRKITKCLSMTPVSLDSLIVETELSADTISTELMMLELDGVIQELPGKYFVLKV